MTVCVVQAWSPFLSSVDIPASAGGTTGGLIDSYVSLFFCSMFHVTIHDNSIVGC